MYSTPVQNLPGVLDTCLQDAYIRYAREDSGWTTPSMTKWNEVFKSITDVRMWLQVWPDSACGFDQRTVDYSGIKNEKTIAPTVVLKFSRDLRYIYHDGKFAYKIKGPVSVTYYDAARSRRLPGVDDREGLIGYLSE